MSDLVVTVEDETITSSFTNTNIVAGVGNDLIVITATFVPGSGAISTQTGAEIKALYELETNAFTDTQFTKLAGIETGATADQTAGEIKTAYESNADTNAFTDAEKTLLGNTSGVNTGDQTLPTTGLDFDPVGTDNSDNNAVNTLYADDYRAANFVAGTDYEPAKGADDNFVTDAQITLLGNTSGINTGDQVLPTDFDPAGTDNSNNNAPNTLYADDYRAANFVAGTDYAAALGVDDNYITDAEKVVIGNTSGTNTGDQVIPVTGVDFDPVGTDNSTDVTLAGTPDYITLAGQVLTRNQVDLTTDVTGVLPIANIATGTPDGTKFLNDAGVLAVPVGSGDAMVANPLSQFAATTSAQLAGVLSDESGTGLAVFNTSPTLITPSLGTPTALVGTNITGTATSFTASNVTTNANLTGHITSVGNAAVLGSFTSAQLNTAISDGSFEPADATILKDADIGGSVQAHSAVLDATTASYVEADETKVDYLTVTGAVDLDSINTRVNDLDASVVLRGTWDASAGTFAGGGTAQTGSSWIVSVAGTVGGIEFAVNDRLIAIVDNASTTVYAANWYKADYTDEVLSVAGKTGAVTLSKADITDFVESDYATGAEGDLATTALQTIANVGLAELDTNLSNLNSIFNGIALDGPSITVTSNGTVITLSLEKAGTGDIRFKFESGITLLDCTPAETVELVAGSAAAPQLNYVYVTKLGGLVANTAGWDVEEHAPIATVLCQDPIGVQQDGVYKLHQWSDHISGSNDQGHLAHLNAWIRLQPATWFTGAGLTPTAGASLNVAVVAGVVHQLHDHDFPAIDTATAPIWIVNHPDTSYRRATDLSQTFMDKDTTGAALGGASSDFYNIVIWGVVSEDAADCKLMANAPSGAYANNNADVAINDSDATAVYDIPTEFVGVGFLIARLTIQETAGTYTVLQNADLRGTSPSVASGGGATGGNEFADSVFRIQDDADATKEIAFQASTIATGTTRTITMPNSDVDLGDIATAAQGALADTALQSFTETNDLTANVTWASIPDASVPQSAVTQHQAALSITESQISNLTHTTSLAFGAITATPTTLSGYGITDAATSVQGGKADTALQSYTEVNDLTAAVTWANVPNANITEGAVTQHETALTITESQISDLSHSSDAYIEYSENKTFLVGDMDTGSMRIRVDCVGGSYTHNIPTGLPIGYYVYYIVSDVVESSTSLAVIVGDGTAEPIHNINDDVAIDGSVEATQAGEFILVKEASNKWRQVRDLPFGGIVGPAGPPGDAPEGIAVKSTGVTAGYVLQADGNDVSAWVALAGGGDMLASNNLVEVAPLASIKNLIDGTAVALKSTPVNGDKLLIQDSEAADILKYITFNETRDIDAGTW